MASPQTPARAPAAPTLFRLPETDSTEERLRILAGFLESEPTVVLFKHSPACPTSRRALAEVESFVRDESGVPVILIDVRRERELASWAAERFGIRHESPQAIVFRRGIPTWHGSHQAVERDRLAQETHTL